jgi:hypothetical protein
MAVGADMVNVKAPIPNIHVYQWMGMYDQADRASLTAGLIV